jgi:transposase, IS5 family
MSDILENNPDIVTAVHTDLTGGSTDSGSRGMSAERVFRCAVLKQYKQYSYRELWERLKDGVSLSWFTRRHSGERDCVAIPISTPNCHFERSEKFFIA